MTNEKLEKMISYYRALGFDTLSKIFEDTLEYVKSLQTENNSLKMRLDSISQDIQHVENAN